MYTTPYILARASPVPSSISRDTGISSVPLTDYIDIQKHAQPLLRRLRQPTNNLHNTIYRLIFVPWATVL